jgi:hypothetical protein
MVVDVGKPVADSIVSFGVTVVEAVLTSTSAFGILRLYGLPRVILYIFGSKSVWCQQAKVLGTRDESDAQRFKTSVADECTMISVAVC